MPLFQALHRSPSNRPPPPPTTPASTGNGEGRSPGSATRDAANASGTRNTLFGRFRRRSSGGENLRRPDVPEPARREEATRKADVPEQEKVPRTAPVQIPQPGPHHRHAHHHEHAVLSPESPKPSVGEPKQPTNLQDALENALEASQRRSDAQMHMKETDTRECGESLLTKEDLKHVFSGAPHFVLERGRNGLWYPQVIFPWDHHDPIIQDLWDRQPLSHESFTLSTLHAHLPVPDEWAIRGDTKVRVSDWRRKQGAKRATFDVGVFEVPNMLSMNGREPGCVGFGHFLELPVADVVKNKGPPVPRTSVDFQRLANLPAAEAYRIMEHLNDPYSECNQETVHDRHRLICDGPAAWKRIGVRDFRLKTVAERLEELQRFRDEILQEKKPITILDKESTRRLYDNLFTKFLYPPPHVGDQDNPYSLKVQVETLTRVLATKGAWFDFSLVEWRMRIGQILWEAPPHPDGDYLDPNACQDANQKLLIDRGLERNWLLLQIVLAAELLLRLDAIVRVAILQQSKDLVISAQEINEFDKLRTGKVNWDLITVRRFLDHLTVKYSPSLPASPAGDHGPSPSSDRSTGRAGLLYRLGSLKLRDAGGTTAGEAAYAWDCILIPRRAQQQLEGLFVFAECLDWPDLDKFKETMKSKLKIGGPVSYAASIYGSPVHNSPPPNLPQKIDRSEMYRKSPSRRLVLLRWPHGSDDDSPVPDVGGWMSRTWLSGLVLPGEVISHFLIATVLENDTQAMAKLGPLANLYGGFVYGGRSWWSKMCIVGRVLSSLNGSRGCMGWISSNVLPHDAVGGEPLGDTWVEVEVKDVPKTSKKPRIRHGTKLALQSTPLGAGELSGETFSLPVDAPSKETVDIAFQSLVLSRTGELPSAKHSMVAGTAAVSFHIAASTPTAPPTTISFPLAYNVQFISSHACRPPHGYATHCCSTFPTRIEAQQHKLTAHSEHVAAVRLPGHPLHVCYKYRYVPLASLFASRAPPVSSSPSSGETSNPEPTWIVDARGSREKEAFARAWCAAVGTSAIIGRVGRTCLACCIREARAVDVGVVIRVGG
ncbi:hypothetical protein VTN02DRAFT_2318 [Thermoascus thermophilus]